MSSRFASAILNRLIEAKYFDVKEFALYTDSYLLDMTWFLGSIQSEKAMILPATNDERDKERGMVSSRAIVAFITVWCLTVVSSAHGQFMTVLNIPPSPNIGNNATIGSDTQLNLHDGGSIGHSFQAGNPNGTSTNVEVNILGGVVGGNFDANFGSVIHIQNGVIGNAFRSHSANVTVSGGTFAENFIAFGGILNVTGGDFGFESGILGIVSQSFCK